MNNNLNYIQVAKINNNFTRYAIMPKQISLNNYNNLSNPIYRNIKQNKNKIKNSIYNLSNDAEHYNSYNSSTYIDSHLFKKNNNRNVIKQINNINKYLIVKNATLKDKKKDKSQDNNQINRQNNSSLNKIQNEIRMIELKLRSDIIKNKIKQLGDLSNDNKFRYKISTPNNNNNQQFLIKKKSDHQKKIKKILKMKINNTDTNNFYLKKKININDLDNDDINNNNYNNGNTYFQTNINNYYNINNNNNNSQNFQGNYKRLNSEQVQSHKIINQKKFGLNQESDDNIFIKTKINKIFNLKRNDSFNKIKKITNYSDIKQKKDMPRTPSVFSNKNLINNYNNSTNTNLYNENYKYMNKGDDFGSINYNNNNKNNFYKPKSHIEKYMNNINFKKNMKNRCQYNSNDLPQGFFDNYFINSSNRNFYNNKTYNNTENNYNMNKKNIDDSNTMKKSYDYITENKIEFSYINKNKKIKNIKNVKCNCISSSINFSLRPNKLIYDKNITFEILDEKEKKENKNEYENIINDKNENINENNKKNIQNQYVKENNNNIVINNYINKEENILKDNNNINKNIDNNNNKNEKNKEIKDLIKDNNNNFSNNSYNNFNNKKSNISNISNSNNKEQNIEEKKDIPNNNENNKNENNDIPFSNNNNIQESKEEIKMNNNNNNHKKKNVIFDEINIIVKYYQNDYIKKAFIYSNKDYKKIKHKYLTTQDHIKNLKKQKNPKSILVNKEVEKTQTTIGDKKNFNLALVKLNELISEVNSDDDDQNDQDEPNEIIKEEGEKVPIPIPFIQKNIKFIKKIEELNKKGVNYRCFSKNEIKLLKKKNKNVCHKFQNNPQNFYSEKLCDNVIKSFDDNKDNNDLDKNNKNMSVNDTGSSKKVSRNNSEKDEKKK